MTDIDLDALDALDAAATPGPWEVGEHKSNLGIFDTPRLSITEPMWTWGMGSGVAQCDDPYDDCSEYVRQGEADATFIAAARTALPALVSEVRDLRARLEAAEQERERLRASRERWQDKAAEWKSFQITSEADLSALRDAITALPDQFDMEAITFQPSWGSNEIDQAKLWALGKAKEWLAERVALIQSEKRFGECWFCADTVPEHVTDRRFCSHTCAIDFEYERAEQERKRRLS